MRELRCSADGVRGRKQHWDSNRGPEKDAQKEGTFGVKQLECHATETPQKPYRLAT